MTTAEIEQPTYHDRMPIGRIRPDPINPRKNITVDDDFIASIRERIVEPLVIRPDLTAPTMIPGEPGMFLIIAGERRYTAATIAELDTVPVRIMYDIDDAAALEMMLVENGQRESLTPIEEAAGYKHLIDLGRTQRQVEKVVGRSQGTVSKRIALLKLPTRAQVMLDARRISVKTATAMLGLLKHNDRLAKVLDFANGPEVEDRDITNRVDRELAQIAHEKTIAKNPPPTKGEPSAAEQERAHGHRDEDYEPSEPSLPAHPLPHDVALYPTPAIRDGNSAVTQCANCGLLACVPDCAGKPKLGACPRCDGKSWWAQTFPVGAFTGYEVRAINDAAIAYCAASADLRDSDGPQALVASQRRDLAHHDLMVTAGYGCECEPECEPGMETIDLTGAVDTADVATVTKNAEVNAAPAPPDNEPSAEETSTDPQSPDHQGDEATEGAATSATPDLEEPWAGYDRLPIQAIGNMILSRSPDQLRDLIHYEEIHGNRAEVIDAALDRLEHIENA